MPGVSRTKEPNTREPHGNIISSRRCEDAVSGENAPNTYPASMPLASSGDLLSRASSAPWTRGSSTRIFSRESTLLSVQPVRRRQSDPLPRGYRARRERTYPKDTCSVRLDTRGEDCHAYTWDISHDPDGRLYSACQEKSANAWYHYPSGRVRGIGESLSELELEGVSLPTNYIWLRSEQGFPM